METDQQPNKEQLIAQLGSRDNTAVRGAVYELRKRGWLCDGSLAGLCLDGINLTAENLWGANLQNVDLSRAALRDANLQGADLRGTTFVGADLQDVTLRSSYLGYAKFSAETILPDGTHWAREIDMKRFTDPAHPDFWRSDEASSPAYALQSP